MQQNVSVNHLSHYHFIYTRFQRPSQISLVGRPFIPLFRRDNTGGATEPESTLNRNRASGRVTPRLSKPWKDTPLVHMVSVAILRGERTRASLCKCLFFKIGKSHGRNATVLILGLRSQTPSAPPPPTRKIGLLSIKKMCFIMTFSERKWQNNSRCSL